MEDKGSTLLDILKREHGKTVFIGARSSFFFVGPSEQAEKDLSFLLALQRFCQNVAGRAMDDATLRKIIRRATKVKGDLGSRVVKKTYNRSHDGSVAIIIEGGEFGTLWSCDEYNMAKKAFLDAARRFGVEI